MIIIEQDKTYFVNFNNVSQVTLAVNKEEEEYAVMVQTIDEEELIMGIYKTEERAKEVLREIVDTFGIREIRNSTYQYADLAIKSRKYSIYEMPES